MEVIKLNDSALPSELRVDLPELYLYFWLVQTEQISTVEVCFERETKREWYCVMKFLPGYPQSLDAFT